jgi:hypothetical protein
MILVGSTVAELGISLRFRHLRGGRSRRGTRRDAVRHRNEGKGCSKSCRLRAYVTGQRAKESKLGLISTTGLTARLR